jgi:hypothetical protein
VQPLDVGVLNAIVRAVTAPVSSVVPTAVAQRPTFRSAFVAVACSRNVVLDVVVTVTVEVLPARVLFTSNVPLPTEATVPNAARPKPAPPRPAPKLGDPLGDPLGRTRPDGRPEGKAPPGPRPVVPIVQVPDVWVMITEVAVRLVTGDGDADGVVLGVVDAAAVAVTQSPGFSAAAVVVSVWLNVVVPV